MLIAGIALLSALLCGFVTLLVLEYGMKATLIGLAVSAVVSGLIVIGLTMLSVGLVNLAT